VKWIACTRMYDVTADARGHWHALMHCVAPCAGLSIECIDHATPAPLADLWGRSDLALAYVCGLPFATHYPRLRALGAPVTAPAGGDRPAYRSVWLVRSDSAFDTLESTFGHRLGWLAEDSHSGFNAPRHALLAHRTPATPRLYAASIGPLGHPRAALAALAHGRIDVIAVDEYWWWLLRRHDAGAASDFRAIGATGTSPPPLLACAAELPEAIAERLAAGLTELHTVSAARPHLDALGILRFASVTRADYSVLVDMDRAARTAGYPRPA
jgi:ABC-type phosphate/phosphonate transport system substrate-binding protein